MKPDSNNGSFVTIFGNKLFFSWEFLGILCIFARKKINEGKNFRARKQFRSQMFELLKKLFGHDIPALLAKATLS